MNTSESWRRTLLEWEALKHYHMHYAPYGGRAVPNPLIEHFLPTVALIKASAVFDECLDHHTVVALGGLPGKYRSDLNGRITFLGDRGLLPNVTELHSVRLHRNAVAHEHGAHATWEEAEAAIGAYQTALEALGLAYKRPLMEYFGERSALRGSNEDGVIGERDFTIGIKQDSEVAYVATWTEKLHSS